MATTIQDEPFLHLHAQAQWYGDAYVVGTRKGLEELRAAIDAALTSPNHSATVSQFANDGEGYQLEVLLVAYDQIMDMACPYTDEIAIDHRAGVKWPLDLQTGSISASTTVAPARNNELGIFAAQKQHGHPSDLSQASLPSAVKWYLGSMNDGLFIINAPPSPSGTDVGPWMNSNGPTMVLNVTDLPDHKAQAIVDAHNAFAQPLTVPHEYGVRSSAPSGGAA